MGFPDRQHIKGFQDIGLPLGVGTNKQVQLFRACQFQLGDVAELSQFQLFHTQDASPLKPG